MALFINLDILTEEEIADDLARKFPLEWTLEQKIKQYFKEIVKNEATNLRLFGSVVSIDNYIDKLEDILFNHYLKVMGKSSDDFLKNLTRVYSIDASAKKAYEDDKSQRITLYAIVNAVTAASIITETSKKDLDKAISSTVTLQAVAEQDGEDFQFAGEFEDEFLDELSSRATTIAATETHKSFEAGKYIAATSLATAALVEITKTWITTLDGRARPEHLDSHMQQVNADEPFYVMDEPLDYPGDPSASVENIVNCGCVAVYSINGSEIERTQAIRPR